MSQQDLKLEEGTQEILVNSHENQQINIHNTQDQDEQKIFFQQDKIENEIKDIESKQIIQEEQDQKQNGIQKNHINQIQNTINEQPDNLNKQQNSENDEIQTEKQDHEQNFLKNNKYLQNGHQECRDENNTDSKINLSVCNISLKNSNGNQNEDCDSNDIQQQNQDKNCINKNNNNGKQTIIQEQNEALDSQTKQIQQNNSIQAKELSIPKEEISDQEQQKQPEKIDELQQTQENDEQNNQVEKNQKILENKSQQQEININAEQIKKDSQVHQNLDIIQVNDQNNIQNKLINSNEQIQQQDSQLNELNNNQIKEQDNQANDLLKNENINTKIIKMEKNIQQAQQMQNQGEDNKIDFQKFTMDLIQQQLDEKQKIIESYKKLVESYQMKEKSGIQQDQEKQEQKEQDQIIIQKVNEQENPKEEQKKDDNNNNDQNYEDIFQQFMKKQEEDYKKKKQVNLESEELKEIQQNDAKKENQNQDQAYINNDNDENKNKIEGVQDKQEEKNTDGIKENTENLNSSQNQNLKEYQNENENQKQENEQKVEEVQNQSYNKFKELQNISNQQQQNLIQHNFNKDNQSQKSGKDHSLSVLSEEENGQGKSLTAQLYRIRGNQLQEEEQQKQPKRIKRSLEGMAFLEIHQLKYREGIKKVLNKKSIQKLIKSVIIKLQKQLECKDKSYDFFKPKNNFNHQTFDNVIKFLKFEFKTNCYPIIVNYQIELSYFLNLHDREDGLYTLFIDFDETKKSSVQMLKQEEINIFFYFWDNQYQQVGGLVNFDKNHKLQMKQNDFKLQQQQELNGLQNSELFNSVMFSQILGKSQQQLFTSFKLEKIKAKKGLVINQEYFQQNCILLQEIQKEKLVDQTLVLDRNQVVQEYLYYDKFLQKLILVKKLNKQVENKSQTDNNNKENTQKFSTFSFKSNDEFEYLIKILLNQIDINDEIIAEQQLRELENNISCQNLQDLIKQIIFYVKVFSKNNKIEFSQNLKYFQKLEGLVFVQKQGDIINNSVVFGEFFGGCEYKNEQKQVSCYMPEYINKNLDNYFHKYMTPSNKSKFIFQVYEQIVDAISFLNKLNIKVENLNEYNILVQRKFIPQRTYQCQYQIKLNPNFFNKYQQEKQNSKANSVSNSSKKQSNESRKNHHNYFSNKQNSNETQIQNETQNLIQQQIQDINSLQNYNGSINITESQMFKTDDSKQVMTNNNQNKLEKKQLGLFYHPRYFYKNYPVTPEKDIVFSLGVIIMSICKRMKLVQFSGYVELDIKNTIEKLTGFPYENIMQFYEFLSQGKIKEGKKFFFQKKYPSSSSLKSYWNKIPKIQDLMQEIQELKNEEQLKKEKSIQQQEKIEKNHKIEVYRKFQLNEGEFKGKKLEDAIFELEQKFGVIEEIELNRQKEEAQKLLKSNQLKEQEEQKKQQQQQQQTQNQQFNRGNQYGNNQYGYQGSYGGANGYGTGGYGYNNSNYNQNQNQNYNSNGQNQNQSQKNTNNNNNNQQEQSQQVEQEQQNQQEQGQITNNQNNQRANGIQNASGQNITVQGSSFKG
ncbi:hypothetical protein PPERSA_06883 [Pseudocohnilembus persalinus]|uniref:Uncharacterized protein n=1 Tax=Pseudocohnilembus persalinus TaxID=266149 RepID=A0A0V0QYH8_PSEPJ|nr:hypothetical protein PPERSA_06883 [Pseudocohnilembus persalinus]|eukprot:KRX07268.1 hypothetical protein PPERSA_06883 [Pseudocohnilembus persalinus]